MLDKSDKIILVTGATGRQGGSTARALLADGWRVRVLTRDTGKPAARALRDLGCEVAQSNLEDCSSVESACRGVYGVFSVQNPVESGIDGEIRQGKCLADAAKAAGVKHFVYASVGSADRNTGIAFFDSKWQIERHIRSLNLPATILRPVWFMDNFQGDNFRDAILEGELRLPLNADTKLQMIAVKDIGAFAALAFDNPDQYLGKAVELAGDELTMTQTAEVLGQIIGLPVTYVRSSLDDIRRTNAAFARMFEWFEQEGYHADIAGLRNTYSSLLTFEGWLRETGWVGIGTPAYAGSYDD